MISANRLKKRYGRGSALAVDDLSFEAGPGVVTGFLGPNGAGKTTTMRMILGLDRPTAGRVTVNGRLYAASPAPMREVGALIEPKAIQQGRTARQHLRWMAQAGAIRQARVDEVLAEVDLGHAADTRIAGFSLGMCQRLGLAAALLGDPRTLVLDEPTNGLDPAGIRWMRELLRSLAAGGRTVFVSSHLLGEMQQTADRVVVIDRGRLVADVDVSELGGGHVRVRTPQVAELESLLLGQGARVRRAADGAERSVASESAVASERTAAGAGISAEAASPESPGGEVSAVLDVSGIPAARIGDLAADQRIRLHELSPRPASLETTFLSLTDGADDPPAQSREPGVPEGRRVE